MKILLLVFIVIVSSLVLVAQDIPEGKIYLAKHLQMTLQKYCHQDLYHYLTDGNHASLSQKI